MHLVWRWRVSGGHYRYVQVLIEHRSILSGSYNNNFHIYDKNAETDVVLQADKSAFKAKKVGAQKSKGGANAKGAQKANGARTPVDTDNIDFNKKILHASWHPREDTIAVCFRSLRKVSS